MLIQTSRVILATAAAIVWVAQGHMTNACLVCFPPVKRTLLEKVEASDCVVIAEPVEPARSKYRIVEVVKGTGIQVGQLIAPSRSSSRVVEGDGPLLLRKGKGGKQWIHETTTTPVLRAFLQDTLRFSNAQTPDRRLRHFVDHLEHSDPRIAGSAYSKLARASYAELRSVKSHLNADQLLDWISDPTVAARRGSLYVTMLGLCGRQRDEALLKKWIDEKWKAGDSDGLGSLLTAYLELRGEEAVRFIEQGYIKNRDRRLGEINAAVDALRVHGETDGKVRRSRVLVSYHRLLGERPQLVELITEDCARWRDWSFVEPLATIRAGGQYNWTHTAIDKYLEASPLRKKE